MSSIPGRGSRRLENNHYSWLLCGKCRKKCEAWEQIQSSRNEGPLVRLDLVRLGSVNELNLKLAASGFSFKSLSQLYQEAEDLLVESKDIIRELMGYKGESASCFFPKELFRSLTSKLVTNG